MAEERREIPEDFELLEEFNSGSEGAFARIVEKHSAPLINFLYRYTRERTTAEDLAQEAFLRLYKAAPGLKPGAKLSTILFRIGYNLAVDLARRNSVRSAILPAAGAAGAEDSAVDPPESGAEPDSLLQERQRNAAVAAALASLPDNQRAAIVLRVYEGRSYAEIAEVLGLSIPSVESLLFRARRNLAKNIP